MEIKQGKEGIVKQACHIRKYLKIRWTKSAPLAENQTTLKGLKLIQKHQEKRNPAGLKK